MTSALDLLRNSLATSPNNIHSFMTTSECQFWVLFTSRRDNMFESRLVLVIRCYSREDVGENARTIYTKVNHFKLMYFLKPTHSVIRPFIARTIGSENAFI